MAFSNQQLFFVAVLLLPMATLGLEDLYQTCGKNFTGNKILQRNIDNALLEMVGKSSIYGYAASSFGVGCEAVYGVTRCQGDMKAEACSACITTAAQRIRTACPDSAESRVWYDEKCFLRYDTDNFIGKPEENYASVWYNVFAANPKAFDQALGELLAEVIETTAGRSTKFGWGESYLNAKETIYGMAQCTHDLDAHACNQCLENALKEMSSYCKYREGCRIFGSSCVMRYEIYKFLELGNAAAAPAPSSVVDNY